MGNGSLSHPNLVSSSSGVDGERSVDIMRLWEDYQDSFVHLASS